MKKEWRLSRTAQRGYMYLALFAVIVAVLVLWPKPKVAPLPPEEALPQIKDSMPNNKPSDREAYMGRDYSEKANNYQKKNPDWDNSNYWQKNATQVDTQHHVKKREPLRVEINTADTLTLQLLHGIGPTYANRIVKYRNRLGGFVAKEQLMEVYGLRPELYKHIEPYLTLDTSKIERLKINKIEIKQLIKHPYIGYNQAHDVIAYRNKGHKYTNINDLRLVVSMDDSTLSRLKPYLDFE